VFALEGSVGEGVAERLGVGCSSEAGFIVASVAA
jgi:hypothetical protein